MNRRAFHHVQRSIAWPILGFLAGVAVLVTVFVRSRGTPLPLHDALAAYPEARRVALQRTEKWVATAYRDSLKEWIETFRTADDSLIVRTAGPVPPATMAIAEASLREEWRSITQKASGVRIAAMVMFDTATRVAGLARVPAARRPSLYYMPSGLDGRTCVALIRITPVGATEESDATGSTPRSPMPYPSLGACAFVAALGVPGPGAREWLKRAGATLATRADWWRVAGSGARSDTGERRPDRDEYTNRVMSALNAPSVALCRHADSTCASLLDPALSVIDVRADTSVAATSGIIPGQPGYVNSVALARRYVLSDLVRDLGRERIARAWQGDQEFISAVATAAGKTPQALGAHWAKHNLPPEDRRDVTELTAASIGAPLLLFALFVVAGLLTTRTRERS